MNFSCPLSIIYWDHSRFWNEDIAVLNIHASNQVIKQNLPDATITKKKQNFNGSLQQPIVYVHSSK